MPEDLEQLVADNQALAEQNLQLKCELLNVRQERDNQMDGNDELNRTNADLKARVAELEALCASQAEDEGLWFAAQTAPEAYLQQELRKLHRAIERK